MRQAPDQITGWLLAARAGDRAAATAFVRATHPDVRRLVRTISGGAAAEDLTQDVYLRAFHALPGYRGTASARTWLLSIARTTCADHLRATVRQRRLDAQLHSCPTVAARPDPAGLVGLDDLVGRLASDRRTAFVLTQILGLSYEETAAIQRIPVGTVRSRVARARSDLIAAIRLAQDRG